MNDFNRCNKVTGIHWLKSPVANLQIKIRLKPQAGILSLPKYEDYAKETNSVLQLDNKVEEHEFTWQQKVFSSWEIQRYSDIHNCITDSELNYHDMINNMEEEHSKIFTYIHDDYHLPLPLDNKKVKPAFQIQNLSSCLESLNIDGVVEDSSSMGHLFRSEENVAINEENQWTAMHVIFDNSEYNEDSQLLLKQEATLLSLYHNTAHGYLVVSPDVNNLELNPYAVESDTGVPWGYTYSVEVGFGESEGSEDLVVLLRKLHKKWEKKQRQLVNFVMPPLGTTQYYVTLEILTATDFSMDHLYIEYHIKLPEGVRSTDALHGRTHVTKSLQNDGAEEWHYGHNIEMTLEVASGLEPPPLQLFFEVISTDWWGRHRTEGYTYLPLSLLPGLFCKKLSCSRPEEMDAMEADSRRFFVGGCHLIKDLSVLAEPQSQDATFRYTSTGTIALRWSIITQTHLPGSTRPSEVPGTSSASALLLGAEAVLRKYKKARARLAAATKGLPKKEIGSGDG